MSAIVFSFVLFQAVATNPAAAPGPITDPIFESVNASRLNIESYYPRSAVADAASGAAIVECVVTAKGALDPCKVLAEEPQGYQFGDAAVNLAAHFRMRTTTRSGASAIGRVIRIPIKFDVVWSMFETISSRPAFHVVTSPKWIKRPNLRDMERLFPEGAELLGKPGNVLLHCQVQGDGHLADCSVRKEEPGNYRFGEAALKLASQLQLDMSSGPGVKAAGKWVDIPVNFFVPGVSG